jgi:hypothetical protein
MGAPNTTGTPNVDDYNLGRGIVYVSELTAGLPGAWRDMGNAPEFNMNVETETLEHRSSRTGLAEIDKEVTISKKVSISFQLDEINAENLAEFLSGEKDSFVNPTVAGVAEQVAKFTNVELGKWYDLTTAAGVRAMDLLAANLTLEKDDAVDVALVLDTDYELDLEFGRVFLKSTAVNIAAGDDMNVTIAPTAAADTPIRRINALTQTERLVAIKFISDNPANNGKRVEYNFHKVSLKADGDFALIGDDWSKIGYSGVLQKNLLADADSPYLTIFEHAGT